VVAVSDAQSIRAAASGGLSAEETLPSGPLRAEGENEESQEALVA